MSSAHQVICNSVDYKMVMSEWCKDIQETIRWGWVNGPDHDSAFCSPLFHFLPLAYLSSASNRLQLNTTIKVPCCKLNFMTDGVVGWCSWLEEARSSFQNFCLTFFWGQTICTWNKYRGRPELETQESYLQSEKLPDNRPAGWVSEQASLRLLTVNQRLYLLHKLTGIILITD